MPSASFKKLRVDWMPGEAALQALQAIQRRRPDLSRQEVIDYALIVALSALSHEPWRPPPLLGRSRYRWSAEPAPAGTTAE